MVLSSSGVKREVSEAARSAVRGDRALSEKPCEVKEGRIGLDWSFFSAL
jgi:hypothetical protein